MLCQFRPNVLRVSLAVQRSPTAARKDEFGFERLISALALCFGWEAFIVLKDVRGLDNTEAERVSVWAARVLLRATLEEQADESKGSVRPSNG